MIVLDHAPQRWYLLQDGDTLLLDVYCSHGPVDYPWVMALDADETARYRADGRGVLDALADRVQQTGAGGLGSPSPYAGRNLDPGRRRAVHAAIMHWRAAGPATPGSH